MKEFRNLLYADFSQPEPVQKMQDALAKVEKELFGKEWPHIFAGKEVVSASKYSSHDPNQPEYIIGTFQNFDAKAMDFKALVADAKRASKEWNAMGIAKRCEVVDKAADIMEERIYEVCACLVREVGKSYIEAYAEVCEAIDFLRWNSMLAAEEYAKELVKTPAFCGNHNRRVLVPHGVFLTIDPFNFQVAIGTDHICKPLIMGNSVIASPSDKASLSSRVVFQIFEDAFKSCGVENNGILNWAPGPGGDIPETLLSNPDVVGLCFTGSTHVLELIMKQHGQTRRSNGGKLVIASAETSGVDAIYVHQDGDLDAAAKGIAAALCGFSGQKCSALSTVIAHQDVYDELLAKTVKELDAIAYGLPKDGAYMGAVVSEAAQQKILSQIEGLKKEQGAKLIYQKKLPSCAGHDVAPTLLAIEGKEQVRAARNVEIFGPVATFMKVASFEEGEEVFNLSDFALTGSIFTKQKALIEHAIQYFRAGNFYINRKCTGALVGSEPFGGLVSQSSLSGTSAGSLHSLTSFYSDKSISGFMPE